MSRERLVSLLWPDNPAESGRHSLDQLLSILRRQFGDSVFLGIDPLRLNSAAVGSDIASFEAALVRGDLATAVNAYSGPFLDGFYLSDAGEFEHWTEGERTRLAGLYRTALERLAAAESERGNPAVAVGWWRRLVLADPLASPGAIGLMRALVATGDRPGAMQHARVYEALVREQLEMPPDPSITSFIEELRRTPTAQVRAKSSAAPPVAPLEPAPVLEAPIAPGAVVAAPSALRKPRWARPWRLALAVAVLGLAGVLLWNSARQRQSARASQPVIRSVAVIPFVNIGGVHDDEYLSDGLTEELISALQRVPGLQVAPRSSSFYYKGKGLTSREVGRQLGVGLTVEGSLQREGPHARVSVALADVTGGFQLWSEVYDLERFGALSLREKVAGSVAETLVVRFGGSPPRGVVTRATTVDPEAYDLYLRGRYFWNRRTGADLVQAVAYFDRAIAKDSAFALAWAGRADAWSLLGNWGDFVPTRAFPLAKRSALRALALDSTRAEVHVSLGIIAMFYEWDWPEAERQYRRALALDSSSANAHLFYGNYLTARGRREAALREVERAQKLEPLSVIIGTRVGSTLVNFGQVAEAIAPLRRAIELDSSSPNPRLQLAFTYSLLGRHDSAAAVLPPLGAQLGSFEGGVRVFSLAKAGRTIEARQTLAEMERLRRTRYVSGDAMAFGYAAVGDRERAFAELERAYTEHAFTLVFMDRWGRQIGLKGDPRFEGMLRRIGLP